MAFEVHMTKAGIGDCINLRLGEKRMINIVIDAGVEDQNLENVARTINSRGEKIDFLIITHDDDDHIAGLEYWAKHYKDEDFDKQTKQIYMNTFEGLKADHILCNYGGKGKKELLSASQMKNIRADLIRQLDFLDIPFCTSNPNELNIVRIKWDENTDTVVERLTEDSECEIEHVDLFILGPTKESLTKYIESAWKNLADTKVSLCDSSEEDEDIRLSDWDYSIQNMIDKPTRFGTDSSMANRVSISFLLRYKDKYCVFCGDANPTDLVNSGKKIIRKLDIKKDYLEVDLVKLPHHGSSRNTNDEFIKVFRTTNYLVSTEGSSGYKHPGKLTFARIARFANPENEESIKIFANYKWWDGDFCTRERWNPEDNKCEVLIDGSKKRTLEFILLTKKAQDVNEINISL